MKVKTRAKNTDNTIQKCVILTDLSGRQQELSEIESVELGIIQLEVCFRKHQGPAIQKVLSSQLVI